MRQQRRRRRSSVVTTTYGKKNNKLVESVCFSHLLIAFELSQPPVFCTQRIRLHSWYAALFSFFYGETVLKCELYNPIRETERNTNIAWVYFALYFMLGQLCTVKSIPVTSLQNDLPKIPNEFFAFHFTYEYISTTIESIGIRIRQLAKIILLWIVFHFRGDCTKLIYRYLKTIT